MDYEEFFKVLALCHATKTKKKKKENDEDYSVVFNYMCPEDETILNFVSKCGVSFEAKLKVNQQNAYKIINYGNMEYYQLLGINYNSTNRQRFSIVFKKETINSAQFSSNEKGILYIKGSFDSMKDVLVLKESEKETLKEMNQSFINLGFKALIYGKRELSSEETEKYNKLMLIYKSSLTMDDFEFQKIFSVFENNITFLTMVCLEIKKEEGIQEIVDLFKEVKMKNSFLSGDDLNSTLIGAYKTGIILNDQDFFHLEGENFDAVLFGIKKILYKLKKAIQKDVESNLVSSQKRSPTIFLNYCVLLSCKTFNIILENEYLSTHFLFILYLSQGVIGYDFDHKAKKKLIKMLTGNVITIGSSWCDIDMFEKSSFAIETKKLGRICSYKGDLILSDKKTIRKILLHEALYSKFRFKFIFWNTVNLSLMLIWPTIISLLINDISPDYFLKEESISKALFILGLSCTVVLSLSHEFKTQYDLMSEDILSLILFFQKKEENNNLANNIIENFICSFIESFYLFIIWNAYYKTKENLVLVDSFFLPNMLRLSSFVNFSINVIFVYIKFR